MRTGGNWLAIAKTGAAAAGTWLTLEAISAFVSPDAASITAGAILFGTLIALLLAPEPNA